jgi:hypothetical protein
MLIVAALERRQLRCHHGALALIKVAAALVQTPPIRSAITYATARHKIGHILGRHQRSRATQSARPHPARAVA